MYNPNLKGVLVTGEAGSGKSGVLYDVYKRNQITGLFISQSSNNPAKANHTTLNVLVILGNPRLPSLNSALADAYCRGAHDAGADVKRVNLGSMSFDPDVLEVSPADQPLEPDLEDTRKLIEWADHLVFVSFFPGGGHRIHQ